MNDAAGASHLVLPAAWRDFLAREARQAFPRECCGLIEGVRRGSAIEIVRLHATRNLARENDRFEIDPVAQFGLMRALRDGESEIVGSYHSHPNGMAKPSARDLAMAVEDGFVWLIAGVTDGTGVEIAAHLFRKGSFAALGIETPP